MSLPLVIVGQRLPGFSCILMTILMPALLLHRKLLRPEEKDFLYRCYEGRRRRRPERYRGYEEAMKCARLEVTHEMTETADFQ